MAPQKKVSRREFLQHSAAGLAVTSSGMAAPYPGAPIAGHPWGSTAMATRVLGGTGMRISLLAFGGGSQFLRNADGAWEPLLEHALAQGVNWFDTSSSYQTDTATSEERFGELLSPVRDKVFISTKFDSREPDGAMREFERSLQRMKTDHVDVLFIHSIEPGDDVATLEAGVYAMLRRLKEEGSVRFIGFSSMNSAERSREAIEKLEFDVALLAMNPTGYGGFVRDVLPAARAKNVGVIAMKVMRDIVVVSAESSELMRYALSQEGVASALVGHYGMPILRENIGLVQAVGAEAGSGMAPAEQRQLEARLAAMAGPHALCWARPGYRDGVVV